jgi:predicted kinase
MARAGRPPLWCADRLDTRLRQGRLGPDHLRAVARELAAFHGWARSDDETATHGTPEAIALRVRERCQALGNIRWAAIDPERLASLRARQLALVQARAERMKARIETGRVRAGHCALRLDRVFVDAASRVAWVGAESGIEIGTADVCADVARLSRQLALHGRRDLAERWLAAYADAADDYELYPLLDLYEDLAASDFVEETTGGANDAGGRPGDTDAAELERLLNAALAGGRAVVPPPRIVAVGGPTAAGKTTLADRIAAEMRAPVLAGDRARDARDILRRAAAVLDSRRPVVIDGGFASRAARAALRELAAERGAPFFFVECRAEPGLLRRRAQRLTGGAACEARPSQLSESAAFWEPVDELPREVHLVVDTGRHPEGNAALIRRALALESISRTSPRAATVSLTAS